MWVSRKRTESVLNGAIGAAAVVLVLLFMKGYGLRGRDNSPLSAISPGTALTVKDVRWEEGDRTVVLALSKGCHFCSESASFYRRLAELARRSPRLQLVAALPQGEEEGREYLSSLGVSIEHVKQAPLDTLGVQGTPTLILVNADGKVMRSWIGELPPDEERRAIEAVTGPDGTRR